MNMCELKRLLRNKKSLLFAVVLSIVFIGGLFWWQSDAFFRFIENKKIERMVAPSKDYSVVENVDGMFIVNEKDEFIARIPENWEVGRSEKKEILKSDREIVLLSRDFNYRPPSGCLIAIQINRVQQMPIEYYGSGNSTAYPFEGSDDIRKIIDLHKSFTDEEKESARENGSEIVLVDQKNALKETILYNDVGKYVVMKIPAEDKLYIFRSTELSKACGEKFNEFLETVSVK
jgi:hypothetical protein